MSDYAMTIGGDAVTADETFGVRNPATGEVFEQAPDCSDAQLDAAFEAAAKAGRDWKQDLDARRQALRDIAGLLMASSEELGAILTAEQGKPLVDAAVESLAAAGWCSYFADLDLPREILQDDDKALARDRRVARWASSRPSPRGTSRSRWPSGRSRRPCWPATPWCSSRRRSRRWPPSRWVELLQSVLPPGVLNVVSGADPLGA